MTNPAITVSSLDADRLYHLIDSLPARFFNGEDKLETELARANVVSPAAIPPTIVTMNSTVKFAIASKQLAAKQSEFELTLVYPKDMDTSGKTISILAPVVSALLGLSQGDEIEWPKPGGGLLKVSIKEIVYQPERAGEFLL